MGWKININEGIHCKLKCLLPGFWIFNHRNWLHLEKVGTQRFRHDNVAKFQVTNICRVPDEILYYYKFHPSEADQLMPWRNSGTGILNNGRFHVDYGRIYTRNECPMEVGDRNVWNVPDIEID